MAKTYNVYSGSGDFMYTAEINTAVGRRLRTTGFLLDEVKALDDKWECSKCGWRTHTEGDDCSWCGAVR